MYGFEIVVYLNNMCNINAMTKSLRPYEKQTERKTGL